MDTSADSEGFTYLRSSRSRPYPRLLSLVIEAKADYVLPVKGNHKDLPEEIQLLFEEAESKDYRGCDADQFETRETGHGRVEHRMYSVL